MVKVLFFALVAFFVYNAIELVTVRYEQRQLHIQMERAVKLERDLETQWRFLELERAELTSSMNMIAEINEKLSMRPAMVNEIIYLPASDLSPKNEENNE